MSTYFCDGLGEVRILNGVVRLEFHQLEPVERGQREMRAVSEFKVALPLLGFAQALGVLEGIRDQLTRDGVLKPSTVPENGPKLLPLSLKSPNFS